MPAAVQRSTICPSRQRVTLRLVVRAMEIIDSIGLEVVNVRARLPVMPSLVTVNISSRPSRRLAAAPGCLRANAVARALASRSPTAGSGLAKILPSLVSTQPRSASGRWSATFRRLRGSAALDRRVGTEHGLHRRRQCLRSVDDDQQPIAGLQAAGD